MIRKITRGTTNLLVSGTKITCSITDPNKVIVLLNFSNLYDQNYNGHGPYLISVSTTEVVVGSTNNNGTFSYQIIEFV